MMGGVNQIKHVIQSIQSSIPDSDAEKGVYICFEDDEWIIGAVALTSAVSVSESEKYIGRGDTFEDALASLLADIRGKNL